MLCPLLCVWLQNSNNPVVLLVKPEQIQVHELKPLPNKAKVQGMVAMRQPPSSDNVRSSLPFLPPPPLLFSLHLLTK